MRESAFRAASVRPKWGLTEGDALRRVLLLSAVLVLLAGFSSTTANASVRWPAGCSSWKCVNAHLNALHSNDLAVKTKLASLAWVNCYNTSFPLTEYPAYLYDNGAGGYFDTTAVDYTSSGDGIDYWVLANTPGTCGSSVTALKSGSKWSAYGHTFTVGAPRGLQHH